MFKLVFFFAVIAVAFAQYIPLAYNAWDVPSVAAWPAATTYSTYSYPYAYSPYWLRK